MNTFKTIVSRYKRVIGEMLEKMSTGMLETDSEAYISFPITINQHDLQQILPHLTPSAARNAFAATYQIPKEWVDQKTFETVVAPPTKTPLNEGNMPPLKKSKLDHQIQRSKHPPLHATETPP